jgi:hypothetical protein
MIVPPEHINYFSEQTLALILERAGFTIKFIGAMEKTASPTISTGIRQKLGLLIYKTESTLLKGLYSFLYRLFTLIKRHLIYKPLNFLILKLNLGGNSILFIAQK